MQTTHDPLNQHPTPDVHGTPELRAELRAQERLVREKRLKKTVLRVGISLLAGVVCAGLLVLTVMYS